MYSIVCSIFSVYIGYSHPLLLGRNIVLPAIPSSPNWTGWGQSRPSRLWLQIAGKLIKYFLFKYLVLQKGLPNLLNLWHDLKKWHFAVLFDLFSSEGQPPRSARFYCYRIKDHPRTGEAGWAVLRTLARQQSIYRLVSGPRPWRMRGVVGSKSGNRNRQTL